MWLSASLYEKVAQLYMIFVRIEFAPFPWKLHLEATMVKTFKVLLRVPADPKLHHFWMICGEAAGFKSIINTRTFKKMFRFYEKCT